MKFIKTAPSFFSIILLLFIFSCKKKDSTGNSPQTQALLVIGMNSPLREYAKTIETGDIIVRRGRDFTSESLRNLNRRNKTYSHCGIASVEKNGIFIYHALGGEWNPDQKILKEPFFEFCNPNANRRIGAFRLDKDASKKMSILQKAIEYKNQDVCFDMSFDLKTDDKMYCAEFVGKAIENSKGDKIPIHRSHINHFIFIGVDDIILCDGMNKLFEYEFNYQNN